METLKGITPDGGDIAKHHDNKIMKPSDKFLKERIEPDLLAEFINMTVVNIGSWGISGSVVYGGETIEFINRLLDNLSDCNTEACKKARKKLRKRRRKLRERELTELPSPSNCP